MTGGTAVSHAAALVLAGQNHKRIARLVISSCEAFENYPPGLPGKNLRLTATAPGGLFLAMQAMRLRPLPVSFGWMAKHPLPADRSQDAERRGRLSRCAG